MMTQLQLTKHPSPLGELIALTDGDALCFLDYADNPARMHKLLTIRYRQYEVTPGDDALELRRRLGEYFNRNWRAFDSLDVQPGGSAFQQSVWRALREIAPGDAVSYQHIAQSLGKPKASRAVGAANGRNPIAIVIPCHRVIGADGTSRGYAGGESRQWELLRHEGAEVGVGSDALPLPAKFG